MPQFISKDGVWHTAKERVGLVNKTTKTIINPSEPSSKYAGEEVKPGEPFIYEGPDRAALYELYKDDKSGEVTTKGQHFKDDVDLQDRTRQRGYKSVTDYAKAFGYSPEKSKARFDELIAKVETHDLPRQVEMLDAAQSGGDDTSGQGRDAKGGFGEQPPVIG